jgi:hypothetical protein
MVCPLVLGSAEGDHVRAKNVGEGFSNDQSWHDHKFRNFQHRSSKASKKRDAF